MREILDEGHFSRALYVEQKRTERSSRRFILMLLDTARLLRGENREPVLDRLLDRLCTVIRETDIAGWYGSGKETLFGVIFTEIEAKDGKIVATSLLNRITQALGGTLQVEDINEIRLSFHVFPEDWNEDGPIDAKLQSNRDHSDGRSIAALAVKRAIDIVGSVVALVVFAPLFIAIAAAIELTSSGPILFRQQRVGQYGRRFRFLKFRSMYAQNDPGVHKEFVKSLISGAAAGRDQTGGEKVYKLTNDARITPIGRLIRRTSLDELPQLFNVLMGDMSLVGPRPPIPYEIEQYKPWHRRRLIEAKPGITGLWQVKGRSRVGFDDMVRLDLEYSRSWSLWLDLKILLETPGAVLKGAGAY